MQAQCIDGAIVWLGEHRVDGKLVARIGRHGDELVAEFPGVAMLRSDRRGSETKLEPVPGASAVALDKLDRGLVSALIGHLQGKVTLHASAVARSNRALAFAGKSGAGKSTMAAAFCAREGNELVADDTVSLVTAQQDDASAPPLAVPTQDVVWLRQQDSVPKIAYAPARKRQNEVSLAGIVHLSFDDQLKAPVLRRLRGQDAFEALAQSILRFAIDDAAVHSREFDQIVAIANGCPILEMRRPRDLAVLDQAVELATLLLERGACGV